MKAVERWNRLESDRTATLKRARDCSSLTIPGLLPPEGYTESQPLPTPYQSLGARGVNNIASKLLLTLFPPGQACFRMQVSPKVQQELQAKQLLTQTQKELANYEQIAASKIEVLPYRPTLFEGLKHLVVTGNVLLQLQKEVCKLFRMDQYVIRRKPDGTPAEAVIKEMVLPETLPPLVRMAAKIPHDKKEPVALFTVIEWRDGRVYEWQEVCDIIVADSLGNYPEDKSPWLPLRWTSVPGAHYGRGLCEEYLGDLLSLEGLTKSIVKFAAAAAKIIFMTKPGAGALWKAINEAESGDAVSGNKSDVETLALEKFNDFQVAKAVADGLETRLSNAFLLRGGTVRNAERVTAEEIRMIAQELEDVLGGTYTVLSSELQLPVVKSVIHDMTTASELPVLPKDAAQPVIVTGFQALGRNHAVNKLLAFANTLATHPMGQDRVNWGEFDRRLAIGYGIEDLDTLLLSDEQYAQSQQRAVAAEVLQRAAAPVAGAAAKAQFGQ